MYKSSSKPMISDEYMIVVMWNLPLSAALMVKCLRSSLIKLRPEQVHVLFGLDHVWT